jgi:hypothetical protein
VRRLAALAIAVCIVCIGHPSAAGHVGICSGSGVLTIRPSYHGNREKPQSLPLYELPGVKRVAEIDPRFLPPPCPVASPPPGEFAATVTDRKGNWYRIIYDEAGRKGWIQYERRWKYEPWETRLNGTSASVVGKQKAVAYKVRASASDDSAAVGSVFPGEEFIIEKVDQDWIRVLCPRVSGWLRWRDREGRSLISPGTGRL